MQSTATIFGSCTAIGVAMIAPGCAHKKPPPPAFDPATSDMRFQLGEPLPATRRSESAIASPTVDTPVAQGTLPLVYLVGSAGNVRIADLDAKRDLATAAVEHNQTIAVDSQRGVIIGGKVVRSATLDPSHQYGIYFSTGSPGVGQFIDARETNSPDIVNWRNPATRKSKPAPVFGNDSTGNASSRP